MEVAQEKARGDDESKVFHVRIGLRHRRMVVQHQQNSSHHENQKAAEAQRAQEPGDPESQRPFSNLDRGQMKKNVLLDRERLMQAAGPRSAAKNGAPDTGRS